LDEFILDVTPHDAAFFLPFQETSKAISPSKRIRCQKYLGRPLEINQLIGRMQAAVWKALLYGQRLVPTVHLLFLNY